MSFIEIYLFKVQVVWSSLVYKLIIYSPIIFQYPSVLYKVFLSVIEWKIAYHKLYEFPY